MKFLKVLFLLSILLTTSLTSNAEVNPSEMMNNGNNGLIQNTGFIFDTDGNQRNDILFKSEYGNVDVYFFEHGISYVFHQFIYEEIDGPRLERRKVESVKTHRIDLNFENSNPAIPIAEGQLETYTNYIKNGIEYPTAHHFEKIIYQEIYPLIDLAFYHNGNGELKYDFIVKPGGNPNDILLSYQSTDGLTLNDKGDLVIKSSLGKITDLKPFSYILENGKMGQIIESNYLIAGNEVRFNLVTPLTEQTLIIDPEMIFSSFYGGSSDDVLYDVKFDGTDIIAVGQTHSSNFPTSGGAHQTTKGTGADGFVFRFDEDGSREWATFYGGNDEDGLNNLDFKSNDDIVAVGFTKSTNLMMTGTYQSSNGGDYDAFVVTFSSSGSYSWSTYYGGTDFEDGTGITVDGSDNIYFSGITTSSNFPVTAGGGMLSGAQDGFLVKLNGSGTRQAARYFGGSAFENEADEVAYYNSNIYLVGTTESTDLPNNNNSHSGSQDAFLAKFNTSLTNSFSRYYGGSNSDWGEGIAVDGSGNIIIVGNTQGGFTGLSNSFTSGSDAFIANCSNSDGSINWGKYYGTDDDESFESVIVDGNNVAHAVGLIYDESSYGADLPTAERELEIHDCSSYTGSDDYFALYAAYNSSGDLQATAHVACIAQAWAIDVRDCGPDECETCARVVYGGQVESSGDIPLEEEYQSSNAGNDDAFVSVVKLYHMDKDYTYLDGYEVSSNLTISGDDDLVFGDTILIKSNKTLTISNSDVIMDKEALILLETDAQLELTQADLSSCSGWKGIENNGGTVSTPSSSSISNAYIAIYNDDPNELTVDNSTFEDNWAHIVVLNSDASNDVHITSNSFGDLDETLKYPANEIDHTTFEEISVQKMVYLEDCSGASSKLHVIDNDFEGTSVSEKFGVHAYNSPYLKVHVNEFLGSYASAVKLINGCDESNVDTNDVDGGMARSAIEVHTSENVNVRDNTIDLTSQSGVGITVNQADNVYVYDNEVTDCETGIEFYSTDNMAFTTNVIHNYVYENTYGLAVAPEEHPVNGDNNANAQTNNINLTIYCNKFWLNDYGIVGCGNLIQQGDASTDASNMFYENGHQGSTANDWDLLWQNPTPMGSGSNIDYYKPTTGTPYDDPNDNLTLTSLTMNGTSQGSSDHDINSSSGSSCYDTWKRNLTSLQEDFKSNSAEVYPNPFNNFVKISGLDTEFQIIVQNIIGETIFNRFLSGEQIINTSSFDKGVYYIRILPETGQAYRTKLIKID